MEQGELRERVMMNERLQAVRAEPSPSRRLKAANALSPIRASSLSRPCRSSLSKTTLLAVGDTARAVYLTMLPPGGSLEPPPITGAIMAPPRPLEEGDP